MPEIPTVRIVHDGFEQGFVRINEEDFDPHEHTLYGDESLLEEDSSSEESGSVDYELANNGWWTIYEDGEAVDSGRGEDALNEALSEYQ